MAIVYPFLLLVLCGLGLASLNVNNTRIQTVLSTDPKDIHFLVYTPKNPKKHRELKIGSLASLKRSNLKPGRGVILYASGFASTTPEGESFIAAYLARGAYNVIIIDYSKLAGSWLPLPFALVTYFEAMRNVKKVGIKGSKLIQFLTANRILAGPQDVHCVGLSLGAHVCGSIGWRTSVMMGHKVGRLSAMDAAGPFNKFLRDDKLSKEDALFVDAYHSDIDGFGSSERFGHADFYINGGLGKNQPGCEGLDPVFTIACAHSFAQYFYLETIRGGLYDGCRCKTAYFQDGKILTPCGEPSICKSPAIAGEDCSSKARGKFYLAVTENLAPNDTTAAFLNLIHSIEHPEEIVEQILAIVAQKFVG